MAGPDHAPHGDQQESARHDEGDADKGFRKGDGKADGKAPIGVQLRGFAHPDGGIVEKPVKKLRKHLVVRSCGRGGPKADCTYRGWVPHTSAVPRRDIFDKIPAQPAAI